MTYHCFEYFNLFNLHKKILIYIYKYNLKIVSKTNYKFMPILATEINTPNLK